MLFFVLCQHSRLRRLILFGQNDPQFKKYWMFFTFLVGNLNKVGSTLPKNTRNNSIFNIKLSSIVLSSFHGSAYHTQLSHATRIWKYIKIFSFLFFLLILNTFWRWFSVALLFEDQIIELQKQFDAFLLLLFSLLWHLSIAFEKRKWKRRKQREMSIFKHSKMFFLFSYLFTDERCRPFTCE
jgi:hypothetical protein